MSHDNPMVNLLSSLAEQADTIRVGYNRRFVPLADLPPKQFAQFIKDQMRDLIEALEDADQDGSVLDAEVVNTPKVVN